jgi:elongation factor G
MVLLVSPYINIIILKILIDYLPSPLEKPSIEGKLPDGTLLKFSADNDRKSQLCALAFKVIYDLRKGLIVYFRVYSGISIFYLYYNF